MPPWAHRRRLGQSGRGYLDAFPAGASRERLSVYGHARSRTTEGDPLDPFPLIDADLRTVEASGYRINAPVRRIWSGERDRHSLTLGLDNMDAELVTTLLNLIAELEEQR